MARRLVLPEALKSAQIKFQRANMHVGTTKREMMRFYKTNEDPAFDIEATSDDRELSIGAIFSLRIVVVIGYPDLPDSFAARFGDAIHNYRCVLDHVAWQLVLHGTDPTPANPWKVQFPIYTHDEDFTSGVGARLPGVADSQIDFIHARHAYKRGKATNDTLLALAELSNDDKHRTLMPMLSAFSGVQHNWGFTDCEPISYVPGTNPKVKPQAVIGELFCRMTGTKPNVRMYLTPHVHVVLEDDRQMFALLNDIREEVMAVLSAPEVAAGVTRRASTEKG